jgi:hypothetical protein
MENRDEVYVFLREQCAFSVEESCEYLNIQFFKFFVEQSGFLRTATSFLENDSQRINLWPRWVH